MELLGAGDARFRRKRPTRLGCGAALGLVVLYGVIATIVSLAVFRTRDIIS